GVTVDIGLFPIHLPSHFPRQRIFVRGTTKITRLVTTQVRCQRTTMPIPHARLPGSSSLHLPPNPILGLSAESASRGTGGKGVEVVVNVKHEGNSQLPQIARANDRLSFGFRST